MGTGICDWGMQADVGEPGTEEAGLAGSADGVEHELVTYPRGQTTNSAR